MNVVVDRDVGHVVNSTPALPFEYPRRTVIVRLPPSINDTRVTTSPGVPILEVHRMPQPTARSHLPRPSDPIRSATDAIAVVSMAIHRPLEAETIAFFLDHTSRSNTITVVSGTTDPDSVLSVAECMSVAGARSPTLWVWC